MNNNNIQVNSQSILDSYATKLETEIRENILLSARIKDLENEVKELRKSKEADNKKDEHPEEGQAESKG